ncbi:MAG: hypothetical protein COA53_10705 [Rhodobacteraceae bacterium]|nr:MAG: hypothetical protein COA53_10705 [Paracoccaceae bacterium]
MISMQAPDVIWVLASARQGGIQPKVCFVNGGGFFHMALLQQQNGQRMARRLHPAPWLVVG